MTRYELLQALEMMLPSRDDWFIADEDDGIVKICFNVVSSNGGNPKEEQEIDQ